MPKSIPKLRAHRVALSVILGATAIRAIYSLLVTQRDGIAGDQVYYSAQAHMNAMGRWFVQPFSQDLPGADHPPLTVLALTPITFLFRHADFVLAQRLFTVAVGVVNVWLLTVVATRIAGRRAGLFAGALGAVHAAFWMGDALILSETYAITALLLTLLAALRFAERGDRVSAASLGVMGGVLALARSELLLLTPLLLVVLAVWRRRTTLGAAVVTLVAASLVVSPWVVWNLSRFEDRALLSTNDGFTLLGANCDAAYYGSTTGSYQIGCALAPSMPAGLDASQESSLRTELAVDYARDHLARLPVVAVARVARAWLVYDPVNEIRGGPGEGRPQWAMTIGVVQFWVLVPLAVIGLRSLDRQRRRLLLAVPITTTIAAVAVAAYWRIRIPSDVVLVIAAGVGTDVLLRRSAGRAGGQRDNEPAAAIGGALDDDGAAMGLHGGPDDGEAEAGPAARPGS